MPYQNATPLRIALHLLMGRQSLTAGDIAERSGFHRATVERMLNGATKFVPARTAKRWAKALGWSEEKLFAYVPTEQEYNLVLAKFGKEQEDE